MHRTVGSGGLPGTLGNMPSKSLTAVDGETPPERRELHGRRGPPRRQALQLREEAFGAIPAEEPGPLDQDEAGPPVGHYVPDLLMEGKSSSATSFENLDLPRR